MAKKRAVELAEADPLAPAQFLWPVAEQYVIEKNQFGMAQIIAVGSGQMVLGSGQIVPVGSGRTYEPLAVPNLIGELARLRIENESALQFAQRFGLMIRVPFCEVYFIYEEIFAARVALRLWDEIQSTHGSPAKFKKVHLQKFGWHKFGVNLTTEEIQNYRESLVGAREQSELKQVTIDSLSEAWSTLVDIVNLRIALQCSPELSPRPRAEFSYTIRLTPNNLIGAIWWPFGRVIMGQAEYRPCKVCGTLIEISSGDHGFRVDREICSNKCKVRDHRRKVKRAKELKAEGRTVKQIATELGSTTDAIKNWLTKKK